MQCPDCRSNRVYADWLLGEYYCDSCGLVVEENIIDFSDISFIFDSEGNLSGYSNQDLTQINKGLGSYVSKKTANRIAGGLSTRYLNTPMTNTERSYSQALPELQMAWVGLLLPADVRLNSAMLYRKCAEKGLTKGRKTEGMFLAVVYNCFVSMGIARDTAKMQKAFGVPDKMIQSYSKLIKAKPAKKESMYVEDHVRKGIASLGLPDSVLESALELSEEVLERKLEIGKRPAVVAGAIIYQACIEKGERISQAKIAKSLEVSERSLRRIIKEIEAER